jgi:hypothetical protein
MTQADRICGLPRTDTSERLRQPRWSKRRLYLNEREIYLTVRLTPRWSQRRLPLEFMDDLDYRAVIELAEPLPGRRGSALDR